MNKSKLGTKSIDEYINCLQFKKELFNILEQQKYYEDTLSELLESANKGHLFKQELQKLDTTDKITKELEIMIQLRKNVNNSLPVSKLKDGAKYGPNHYFEKYDEYDLGENDQDELIMSNLFD